MKTLKYLPLGCLLLAIALIAAYSFHFLHAPLSDDTSDWGAWGSYINIGISLISVSLIYITYQEQQKSNKIARFEEHYHVTLKTAIELFERKKDIIKASYQKIEAHFRNSFDPLTDYTQKNMKEVMRYYYSLAVNDVQQDCDEVFCYFYSILNSFRINSIIDEDEKFKCYTEMSCVLSEEARILFLFWGCSKVYDVSWCYDKGLFRMSIIKNKSLENIVRFVCTGKRPEKEEVDIENIDFGDNTNEKFQDTYNRIFNNKDN